LSHYHLHIGCHWHIRGGGGGTPSRIACTDALRAATGRRQGRGKEDRVDSTLSPSCSANPDTSCQEISDIRLVPRDRLYSEGGLQGERWSRLVGERCNGLPSMPCALAPLHACAILRWREDASGSPTSLALATSPGAQVLAWNDEAALLLGLPSRNSAVCAWLLNSAPGCESARLASATREFATRGMWWDTAGELWVEGHGALRLVWRLASGRQGSQGYLWALRVDRARMGYPPLWSRSGLHSAAKQ